jgi:hypothetical protein
MLGDLTSLQQENDHIRKWSAGQETCSAARKLITESAEVTLRSSGRSGAVALDAGTWFDHGRRA